MRWLIDSNLLLRAMERADPRHAVTRRAIGLLASRQDVLCFTLQGLTEFWNVCTRPTTARSGLGLSVAETDRRMRVVERYFTFLEEPSTVRTLWRQLVLDHQVRGVHVHDARLVAAMLAHNLTHLLTFNTADFKRYTQIVVVHPQDVLDGNV